MKQEEFDTLVKNLEEYAQRSPRNYKLRVVLLGILGYAYIFMILAVALALLALMILTVIHTRRINNSMMKFILLLLVVVCVIFSSLWVHIPPPQGLVLKRKKVPQLFKMLDELTKALKAPKFHHVILTGNFNAGVIQIPRLGLLGWHQNYLIIGLSLMQGLSPKQFEAVLAHEFGHLSGKHNLFSGWIYRQRNTWIQLLEKLGKSQNQAADIVFTKFLNWYAPFFEAYSFVFARATEYEADSSAVNLLGSQTVAETLISVSVKGQLSESVWSEIYQQADEKPKPLSNPYQKLAKALSTDLETEKAEKFLQIELAIPTDNTDTHPCMKDRLKAIGYTSYENPTLPSSLKETAAEKFFGSSLSMLTNELNQEWQTSVNYKWQERYNHVQNGRSSLQKFAKKASKSSLTIEEYWEQAKLTAEFEGNEAAIPFLKALLKLEEDHVSANALLGKILINSNQEEGIQYLEKVMAKQPKSFITGCQLIYNFLQSQGREKEANQYLQRAKHHNGLLALAQQERFSSITKNDKFVEHDLPLEFIESLQKQIADFGDIRKAYLVKRVVQYFPEEMPAYVLAVSPYYSFLEYSQDGKEGKILTYLTQEIKYPAQFFVEVFNNPDLVKLFDSFNPIYSKK